MGNRGVRNDLIGSEDESERTRENKQILSDTTTYFRCAVDAAMVFRGAPLSWYLVRIAFHPIGIRILSGNLFPRSCENLNSSR